MTCPWHLQIHRSKMNTCPSVGNDPGVSLHISSLASAKYLVAENENSLSKKCLWNVTGYVFGICNIFGPKD